METLPPGKMRFIPLGGVGEIGKNLYVYHVLDQLLIVDCGLKFPDERMYGVDLVVPDVRWLVENRAAVQGIVITHGHEDHIGALAFILPELNVPVYAPPLAIGLAKNRLSERKLLGSVTLKEYGPDDVLRLGHFVVEPIRVAHSIPDSYALSVATPAGRIIHTGDFKIDHTPVDGQLFDLVKLARISEEGVLALVSDTTNIERSGTVPSERVVAQTFDRIFREAKGRIIIASFASQIHRMQMAVDAAARFGRKVVTVGRSMTQNFDMASSLGYLTAPEGIRVRAEDMGQHAHHELTILTTGSQGEPLAGLSRMSADDHRHVRIEKGDTIVLSATPIPGNEAAVWQVVNRLVARGADVIHDHLMPVHVSGHGFAEDLKLVLNLTNPQYVIPVHGEHRMMALYARMAAEMGWLPEDIFRLEIGDVLEMDADRGRVIDRVPGGSVLIDSDGKSEIHELVVRDRQILADDGYVVAAAAFDPETGEIVSGPEIISRGFVYMDHSAELMEAAADLMRSLIEPRTDDETADQAPAVTREIEALQNEVRTALRKLFEKRTGRRPLVQVVLLPV